MATTWHPSHLVMGIHDGDRFYHYTVGLAARGLPELILDGMSYEQGGLTLNVIAYAMEVEGLRPAVGSVDTDMFTAPTLFGAVSAKEIMDRMCQAVDAAYPVPGKDRQLPPGWEVAGAGALQVIWSDRAGFFPGEPGFAAEFKNRQRLFA